MLGTRDRKKDDTGMSLTPGDYNPGDKRDKWDVSKAEADTFYLFWFPP